MLASSLVQLSSNRDVLLAPWNSWRGWGKSTVFSVSWQTTARPTVFLLRFPWRQDISWAALGRSDHIYRFGLLLPALCSSGRDQKRTSMEYVLPSKMTLRQLEQHWGGVRRGRMKTWKGTTGSTLYIPRAKQTAPTNMKSHHTPLSKAHIQSPSRRLDLPEGLLL